MFVINGIASHISFLWELRIILAVFILPMMREYISCMPGWFHSNLTYVLKYHFYIYTKFFFFYINISCVILLLYSFFFCQLKCSLNSVYLCTLIILFFTIVQLWDICFCVCMFNAFWMSPQAIHCFSVVFLCHLRLHKLPIHLVLYIRAITR